MSDLRRSLSREENTYQIILFAILLNSADAFFTSLALDCGVAELNPLMAEVLRWGMTWFLFNKLIIVNVLILLVGLLGRKHRIGRIGMVLVACTYTLLSVYHIANLSLPFMIGK